MVPVCYELDKITPLPDKYPPIGRGIYLEVIFFAAKFTHPQSGKKHVFAEIIKQFADPPVDLPLFCGRQLFIDALKGRFKYKVHAITDYADASAQPSRS